MSLLHPEENQKKFSKYKALKGTDANGTDFGILFILNILNLSLIKGLNLHN